MADVSDLCACGAESEYGCHGLRNSELHNEWLCASCYYKKKVNKHVENSSNRRPTFEDHQVRLGETLPSVD